MEAPVQESRTSAPREHDGRRSRHLAAGLALSLAALCLAAAPPRQQSTLTPDQVFRNNPRTGKIETITGVVVENSLSKVRVDRPSGDRAQFEGREIVEIVWSSAPTSFKDGNAYMKRGEYERAIAAFRSAATDSEARDVVQAAARRGAARGLLAAGSIDPNRYAECISECDRFLSDHADNRDVPSVLWLKARALRLSGKGAEAAQAYKALYEEGANDPPTAGYDRVLCLTAGLDAAEAFLAAGDTLGARELYATLQNSLQSLLASLDETADPSRVAKLRASRGAAALGEGFCLLADGQLDQALSFFEGRISSTDATAAAERGGAMLGLAEAYYRKGKHREAQIEFAKVSAVDYSSADHRARALLGLARASIQLKDTTALEDAKRFLTAIQKQYADTPAAREAGELLKTL